MARTSIGTREIRAGGVERDDLNTDVPGQAVLTKVIAGNNVSIAWTGIDAGTGDVTINSTTTEGAIGTAVLHVQDRKAQGTDAGTFIAGAWRTRDLNSVRINGITGASVANNQITLPAGTYLLQGFADANRVNGNQVRLWNVTDATTSVLGMTSEAPRHIANIINGTFTILATKVLEVQHICAASQNANGFGVAANFDTEIYTDILIWEMGEVL